MIAATNLPSKIDPAARQRFGKHIEMPLPSPDQRASYLHRESARRDQRRALVAVTHTRAYMKNVLKCS